MNRNKLSSGSYVVCLDCAKDDVDLVIGKLYRVAKTERSDPPSMLRVVDESREDYLYPASWFAPVVLPARAKRALITGST